MASVPSLNPKRPGFGIRVAGLVLPGVRRVSAQIEPYTRHWSDQNQMAAAGSGPLLVAIGDSTALGIGATAPTRGYIGLLKAALEHRDGQGWRAINLAQSGARAADGVDRQLPILHDLIDRGVEPTTVVCCLGSNDVVWSTDTTEVRDRLRTLIAGLPVGSTIGLVAGGSPRARLVNRAVRQAADDHGCGLVDPWREPGPGPAKRLADDRFHPNDLGYVLMSRPFARHLEAPEPSSDDLTSPPT